MGDQSARAPRRHLRATVRVVVIDTAQYDTQIERTVYWGDECARCRHPRRRDHIPSTSAHAPPAVAFASHPIPSLMSQNRCHMTTATSPSSLTSHQYNGNLVLFTWSHLTPLAPEQPHIAANAPVIPPVRLVRPRAWQRECGRHPVQPCRFYRPPCHRPCHLIAVSCQIVAAILPLLPPITRNVTFA